MKLKLLALFFIFSPLVHAADNDTGMAIAVMNTTQKLLMFSASLDIPNCDSPINVIKQPDKLSGIVDYGQQIKLLEFEYEYDTAAANIQSCNASNISVKIDFQDFPTSLLINSNLYSGLMSCNSIKTKAYTISCAANYENGFDHTVSITISKNLNV